jgi:crotonobetainyl-CoA:carnitine CoA-transferase CaiB-like acyl-CoA transferase
MQGPLAGVRVLEVASVVMAPWACQTLGDLGADVIKVEPPQGDSNRQIGPARHAGMGALFLSCNRNKRSLVLDLKHELGRRALLRLLEGVDVLVHNHRPATLAGLGLEPAQLLERCPRLIVCATCGFDSRGPLRDRPAYDDSIQAASGLTMLAAGPEGEPRYVPTIVADKTTASTAVAAICAALYARERTGRGQQVEVPMFETLVAFLMAEHLQGQAFEPPLSGFGYARLLTPYRRPHRTSNG